MISLLADLPAPDSPAAVGWFVLIFFGLMGGLYYTVETIGKLRGKTPTEISPNPLVVQEHKEFVPRSEFVENQRKLDDELKRHAARRSEIYNEQKLMASRLATLEAETGNQTRTLGEIKAEQAAIRAVLKEDNESMHGRIGEVLQKLGEIRGEMKGMGK